VTRILLIDDDEAATRLVTLLLTEEPGREVRAVASGGDAVTAIEDFGPDLIVIDYRLPDLDGLAVIREARGRGYAGAVLMLTASSPSDPIVASIKSELGDGSILLKPFDIDDLAERVAGML